MTIQARNYIEYLHSLQTLANGKLLLQVIYDQESSFQGFRRLNVLRGKSWSPISQKANSHHEKYAKTLNKKVLAPNPCMYSLNWRIR